jgi:two-component system cell cycle sensor histidine kinase/response regulator CckA
MYRDIEQKYQALFEQSPYGILVIDTKGRFVDFNETAHRDLGYTREEFARLSIADIDPDETADDVKARIDRILKEGAAEFEVRHKTKRGEIRDVHVIIKALVLSGQTLFHSIWRDITESKRAANALRQSEDKFRSLFESATDAIFILDMQGNITDANKTAYERLGYTKKEMLSMHVSQLDHPDSRKKIGERIAHLKQYGAYKGEVVHLRKDGTVMPAEINARVMNIEGREVILSVVRDISERKRTEDALRTSEERLRQSVRVSKLGIFDHDQLADTIYWSPRQREIYGWGPDEPVTLKSFIECIHPEDRERIAAAVRLAHDPEGDGLFEVEHRIIRRDGSIRWVTTRSQTFFSGEGGARLPVQTIGAVRDITDDKEAADRIGQSEQRFHALFDHAPLGIVIGGPDRVILDCNVAFQKMLGYSLNELKSLSIPDISHHGDDVATRVHYRDMMEGKINSFTMEKRHIRKDGTILWTNLTGTVVRNEKGAPQFVFGIVEDISDRKKMEEDLRNSRDFIERILDTVDEAFIVIDRDYRIIMANSAYGNQVGSPVREIIGKRCHEISHHSSVPCYEAGEECSVRHCFDSGEPHSCLHKHRSKDGSILYVETKAFPLKDSTGAVTSVIETVNNITDKHLLEEEQLKTQKLEAIGTLAGGIAHDFNNLLQGVFGYISMARIVHDEKQKSLDMLEQAEKALHMTVNLTSQLLTFSKGGKPLTEKIALRPVIENSAKFALSGSRIDCRLEIASELWTVEADEGQIAQVIQNLVLNAEQAMPMGGIITIAARNVHPPGKELPPLLHQGNYIEISIRDSGIGIPAQHLPKIFDPYFTTKDKGSGLGLATCYSIIKNHGGLIDVRSKLGEGTTFLVYLPALATTETSTMTVSEDVKALRKGRILLMDDDEIVRDIAGLMIRSLGHDVEVVRDGKEAIAMYSESLKNGGKFDVIIMDLTVRGGMGGEQAIRELLLIDPDIKAIVSSGYTDSATIAEYKAKGFRACLSKPYDVRSLNATLNGLLA